MTAAVIHGNKSQNARTRALDAFKSGEVRVLVATDIAARGLHIPQLPLVVNFDLPMVAEDYIHRVGRTGRAGRPGRAVSLVSPADRELLRDIQKVLTEPLVEVAPEGFSTSQHAVREVPADTPRRQRHGRQGHGPSSGPRSGSRSGSKASGRPAAGRSTSGPAPGNRSAAARPRSPGARKPGSGAGHSRPPGGASRPSSARGPKRRGR